MTVAGRRVRLSRWIHAGSCVVQVEVDAVVPNEDPSEPSLEPQTLRWLDQIQELANAGRVDETEKYGVVYVRR